MARFGRRRGGTGGEQAPAQGAGAQPTSGGAQPTAGGAQPTQPPTAPPTGPQPAVGAPEPTVNERLEGQRSWLAQLDRRVGVRTYAGAAAVVIALAAAAVALVLVLQLDEESAKTADIDQLREEIAGVEDTATEAAQDDVQSMTEKITQLESDIAELGSTQDSTDQEISVIEDDIQDLRDQVADLDQQSSSGSGGSSP